MKVDFKFKPCEKVHIVNKRRGEINRCIYDGFGNWYEVIVFNNNSNEIKTSIITVPEFFLEKKEGE